MTIYWDTSALIWACSHQRLVIVSGVSRPHSLAEMFSNLTGKGVLKTYPDGSIRRKQMGPDLAAKIIKQLAEALRFVDVSAADIAGALENAKARGIQSGRVHDLLHAVAAAKAGADEFWTTDRNDLHGLTAIPLRDPSREPVG